MGIDVSSYAVDHGRRQGLDLRATTLSDAGFDAEHFDVVLFIHSFEHVPDPLETLAEARRIATPGACLVVELPNARSIGFLVRRARWSQLKPPEHLKHFSVRSLGHVLKQTGWRILRTQTMYQAESAVIYLQVVQGGGGWLIRAIRLAQRVGLTRLIEKVGLGGFLRVFAVADDERPSRPPLR